MEYRKATPHDLTEVFGVYQSAIIRMRKNGIDQWDDIYPSYDILKKDIEKNNLYVGEKKNTIAVSFVLSGEVETEYDAGAWQYPDLSFSIIHRLCVHPDFWCRGVGQRTVAFIEKNLKAKGMGAVRLDAFSENPAALHLYEKMGYRRVGQVDFRKGIFYLFEKKL